MIEVLDNTFEDYLLYTNLDSSIADMSTNMLTAAVAEVDKQDIDIPARSPARISPVTRPRSPERLTKNNVMPSSPEMSDASSFEYRSYGSHRSSRSSVFSNNDAIDVSDKAHVIDLDDDDDYELILELLDYIDADEDDIVYNVDEVVNVVGIHSGISGVNLVDIKGTIPQAVAVPSSQSPGISTAMSRTISPIV